MADRFVDAPDDARAMIPPSPYMASSDLVGRDWIVTIKGTEYIDLERRPGMPNEGPKPAVFFEEHAKGLLCGAKNWKQLIAFFGRRHKTDWAGKTITIYPTTDKGKGGGMVDCVRIRGSRPTKPSTGPMPADVPVDQESRRNQMEQAGELPKADHSELVNAFEVCDDEAARIELAKQVKEIFDATRGTYSSKGWSEINAANKRAKTRLAAPSDALGREPGSDDQ